ncbi:MAG: bile acid:sodium symporter family protein [Flavobacteriaceae bacterium]
MPEFIIIYGPILFSIGLLIFAFYPSQSLLKKLLGFTALVSAAVILGLKFPSAIAQPFGFAAKTLIIPLIMLIMFAMGVQLQKKEFIQILKAPKAIGIGLLLQFLIMPIVGAVLAFFSNLPPEVAAGIILVGCSPSGVASNVMTYLAKGNLPLSLTLTACATLLAPLFTPLLMLALAKTYIDVNPMALFLSTTKMVVVPIVLGLIVHPLLSNNLSRLKPLLEWTAKLSITIIIAISTSLGQKTLAMIGGTLLLFVLLHNLMGYFFGFHCAKLFKLSQEDTRTICIEVGMQNSGLATGLALELGKLTTMGLASTLFGPVMNSTGSILASIFSNSSNTSSANVSKKL